MTPRPTVGNSLARFVRLSCRANCSESRFVTCRPNRCDQLGKIDVCRIEPNISLLGRQIHSDIDDTGEVPQRSLDSRHTAGAVHTADV